MGVAVLGAAVAVHLKQNMRPALAILMAAVAVVLLIPAPMLRTCCWHDAASRARRSPASALGGSRGRFGRQMLTESFVLAFTWRRTGACDCVLDGPIARGIPSALCQ